MKLIGRYSSEILRDITHISFLTILKNEPVPDHKRCVRTFRTEKAAREWEEKMLKKGYKGDTDGKGWKYGYTYPVTRKRKK